MLRKIHDLCLAFFLFFSAASLAVEKPPWPVYRAGSFLVGLPPGQHLIAALPDLGLAVRYPDANIEVRMINRRHFGIGASACSGTCPVGRIAHMLYMRRFVEKSREAGMAILVRQARRLDQDFFATFRRAGVLHPQPGMTVYRLVRGDRTVLLVTARSIPWGYLEIRMGRISNSRLAAMVATLMTVTTNR